VVGGSLPQHRIGGVREVEVAGVREHTRRTLSQTRRVH
jgi:hypothetical protein